MSQEISGSPEAPAGEAEPKTVIVKLKSEPSTSDDIATVKPEPDMAEKSPEAPAPQQQIYIIQTTDGSIPMEGTEVVVADDMAVYETVSALEQLSRGQVVTTTDGGELMVYEEVVLPDESSGSIVDQFVDVQEVEVGDGRSASPVKIDTVVKTTRTIGGAATGTKDLDDSPLFIPLMATNTAPVSTAVFGQLSELHCPDCGKLFKSRRSLFGHKKEKHSGVTEVHHCPECGKSFGRKSNLKAHRESLHYGKKFPCSYCERIFTNRSSMNQHIKKTHIVSDVSQQHQFVMQE